MLQDKLANFFRGLEEVIPENGKEILTQTTLKQQSLRIKWGADPSAPDLHLGHLVVLKKLRLLQDLGHNIDFIIGDFTAMIGDPTGKSETRKPLAAAQIQKNAATYQEQIFKILERTKTKIHFNSEWLEKMSARQLIETAAKYTVARMLEREDFQKRFKSNQPISVHEFLYPLLQGYDSVHLKSQVEIGGTDQKFNVLMGRHLQREAHAEDMPCQIIITVPILEGLDGVQKMSKSLGNHIGIMEEPSQIFGKLMSIPDQLIMRYFQLLTERSDSELKALTQAMASGERNPKQVKEELATDIVSQLYDAETAAQARLSFQRVFSQKEVPENMPELCLAKDSPPHRLDKFLGKHQLAPSVKEAGRLIEQGAVEIDGQIMTDPFYSFTPTNGAVLKIGKRRYYRLKYT